jgi:acid stress-induced BolA-like protein IbaG/YrbA
MDIDQLEKKMKAAMPEASITAEGDGYYHALTVISDTFEGLNQVKRQQAVYAVLHDEITSGECHALTIKALTPEESAQHG